MNELVYLKKDDAFTDSMVIAEATNNQHKSVVAIIAILSSLLSQTQALARPVKGV